MRSQKEQALDTAILETVQRLDPSGVTAERVRRFLEDKEIQAIQEYANTVSIIRLHYNDHGPVHMRTVALNAAIMMGLLRQAGIKTSLEREECGSFEDSLTAVLTAALLHDAGMSVGRQDHEIHSAYIAYPILGRLLGESCGDIRRLTTIRSLALEGITGHMGNRVIHSIEAGVILVADGCDMKKGRARIPLALAGHPRVGDIHQYSANSIEDVRLSPGQGKPIRIEAAMSSEVGFFQIEEVLLGKINASTIKDHIELYAQVHDGAPKQYL